LNDLGAFLTQFVRPLVEGGDLHIGEPLELETVVRWETELSIRATEVSVAIDEARTQTAATLVVRPPALAFEAEELRLAAALYDALVLAHPSSEGFTKRRARRRLGETAALLATVDPPRTRRELIARHTLLARIYALHRIDTHVSWWTGRADFRGQQPPRRLLLWPAVRRVREERAEIPVTDVLAGEAHAPLLLLAAATPLTDAIALAADNRPRFRWAGKRAILEDPDLSRAVAYAWVPDLHAEDALAVVGRAAAAFQEEWGKLPGAEARLVLAFFVHIMALVALAEAGFPDLDAPSPVLAAALRDPDGGAALACALPNAAARIEPELTAPPGVADEPRLGRRFRAHRMQVENALSREKLRDVGLRLRLALRVLP
jgi:hypothetical protein